MNQDIKALITAHELHAGVHVTQLAARGRLVPPQMRLDLAPLGTAIRRSLLDAAGVLIGEVEHGCP